MSRKTDGWRVSTLPPDDYAQWALASGSLFAMPTWGDALVALGAEPIFAWNSARRIGATIACFRRGGFRIGVLGLPVSGEHWDTMEMTDLAECVTRIGKLAGLDLMRVNRSTALRLHSAAISARPEVWIDDLAQWQPGATKRLRKDLTFARRANPGLQIVDRDADPTACFRLYSATIDLRGGRLRYPQSYFDTLARIAERTDRLQIFSALDADQGLRGFAALAMHGNVGYYLHSGADAKGKREGVADLLLESIALAAREAGCARLTLMASPWEQPGLIRFKQKWGEQQGLAPTYDFAFGAAGHCGRLLSRWMARSDRRAAQAWVAGAAGAVESGK